MKTLALLRHAKSAWDDPGLPDFDRPLAARGTEAARRIGRHLAATGTRFDLVLCSAARRARETLDRVIEVAGQSPEIVCERGLYLCGAQALSARIATVPPTVERLLLVAHNPDLHDLAAALAAEDGSADAEALGEKYPTGALAIFEVEAWARLTPARLMRFVVPRTLNRAGDLETTRSQHD